MWLLRNEDKGLTFRVQPGKSNIISRKEGDLLLLGDQSISRKHAEITVPNENQSGGIVLKDLGSKYGTFTVQGEELKLTPNEPITVSNGDAIRFGIQWNTWRVEYFPLVVATSTLNAGEKAEVQEVVATLGGEVVKDWQPCCTHLTMNKLTVTVKVVCALACGKPIVVPGYWNALKDALGTTETKLPDYKDFVPPLAEALLNPSEVSFTPDPERRNLFSGYTFVAASAKQLARIKPMVTAAGGNAVEFSARSWPDSKLMQDKTILMLTTAGDKQGSQQSQVPDGYMAAARKLKAAGVRCVPESEIGLSILHCSVARYCNPRHSPQSLLHSGGTQDTQQITVICPSTQDSTKPLQNGMSNSTSSKKRALDASSEEDTQPNKKANTEDMFSSEAVEDPNIPSTSFKRSAPKEKPPVYPSLDLFAPSGQTSGQTNLSKSTINATPNVPENIPKTRETIINPSLDMFATSGQIPNRENRNEVNPSCQDMFASNESRQTVEKRMCDKSSPASNRQPKVARIDEINDDFSFSTNKKISKPQKTSVEIDDDFSFTSTRKTNRQSVSDRDPGDEFSFVSAKKGNHQKGEGKVEDLFLFNLNRNSKKRNRQSNADMFDSIDECATSNNRASSSKAASNGRKEIIDDLFAFAGGPATKKRKDNESALNIDEPDAEVRIGLFCRKGNPSLDLQNASEPTVFEEPMDDKNLVTFSKDKPCPKIKQEGVDEEIDELAEELQNATVIVVKPLVVVKEKPVEPEPAVSGKNFKKFRKVTGYKRAVPHIIGGSDLVPHFPVSGDIDDVLPPSPPPNITPDDVWGFPNEKKKGRLR